MIELIGLLASLLTLLSFIFTKPLTIRVINLLGAISFMIYGICLVSPSLIILNIILIFVHIYHIIKLNKNKVDKEPLSKLSLT